MPHRVAFFVEGQTEQIFLCRLLREVLPVALNLNVEVRQLVGRRLTQLEVRGPDVQICDFLVLIVDCGNDEKVLSFALDQMETMSQRGYRSLTLLRDLFPQDRGALAKLLASAKTELDGAPVNSELHVAVMETEAWFLADGASLMSIDARLTTEFIEASLGVSLEPKMVEGIKHPSVLLDRILQLTGRDYKKTAADVWAIVTRLDFADMVGRYGDEVPSLAGFLQRMFAIFA